jgi:hypothetical protein
MLGVIHDRIFDGVLVLVDAFHFVVQQEIDCRVELGGEQYEDLLNINVLSGM